MRDFVLSHQDTLKFVVSYHSYGNMLVIPYSGMWPASLTDEEKRIYHEIYDDAHYASRDTIMGNGHEMVKYYSNGEASDWILRTTGIIAMSPELASQDI